MKVIEYQRKEDTGKYTLRMIIFKTDKEFLEYTTTIQKHCKNCNITANYWKIEKDHLEKILYISNEGLYCTL